MHKKRSSSKQKNDGLVINQDHPFQPQYKAHEGERETNIPYQSIKNSVPTLQNSRNIGIEMPQIIHNSLGIQPNGIGNNIHTPFPIISNNQQNIPIGVPIGPTNNINASMIPNPSLGIPIGFQPNHLNPNNSLPPINPALSAIGENFFQQLGGFNNSYYNALDPNLAQRKNTPLSIPSSSHLPILMSTIIMLLAIVMALVGLNNFLKLTAVGAMIGGGVVVYLVASFCLSSIRKYIFNLKKFSDYSALYNKMKNSKGYFVFNIQCYHYSGNDARRNGRSKNRIVTHTARHELKPIQSLDDSGQIENLKIKTEYAFVKYLKRYYFTDKMSEKRFIQAFNYFVASNKRDLHQTYTYNFQLPGFQQQTGFSATGDGQKPKILYVILTIFGLCYPFSLWIERSVTRLEVNILKKLTV